MSKILFVSVLTLACAQFSYAGTAKTASRKTASLDPVAGTLKYSSPMKVCMGGDCKSPNQVSEMQIDGPAAQSLYNDMASVPVGDEGQKAGQNIYCKKIDEKNYYCTITFSDISKGTAQLNSN